MNACKFKSQVESKIQKPFPIHDKKNILFKKGCGPAISGYWG